MFGLILALAMQTMSGTEDARPRRISEELYYLHPYQHGAYSCDRRVAVEQGRLFGRRFARRIRALKRQEAADLGPEPGFDVVPLKQCTPSRIVRSTGFMAALDKFDADLASLEASYRRSRTSSSGKALRR